MLARELLGALPAGLSAVVLFRLDALRPLADDRLLRHMFVLPDDVSLVGVSHVALTAAGPVLASTDGQLRLASGEPLPAVAGKWSLRQRFAHELGLLPADEPDCLGVGQSPGAVPVGLAVRIDGGTGHAVAALGTAPDRASLALLRAVGVEYLGSRAVGDRHLAYFSNRLDQHLMAGALAGFTRTDHCNLFFLAHAHLDGALTDGLVRAAHHRIAFGRDRVQEVAEALSVAATTQRMAMRSIPPPPESPYRYGDLVPLGFLGFALAGTPAGDRVRRYLVDRWQDGLWSFDTGGLPTATDTSLVALGVNSPQILRRLAEFTDPGGGYLPQLSSNHPAPGRMVWRSATAHWCQTDFATSCLVFGRRRRLQPLPDEAWRWLTERFDRRGGMFFANPFLTDWALSTVLVQTAMSDTAFGEGVRSWLRDRLREELLGAQQPDGSFGRYDPALSTALAILALANLGERGGPTLLAQLRLLDYVAPDGRLRGATPFFSTVRLDGRAGSPPPQHVDCFDSRYAVTWYGDDAGLIGTAVTALALGVRTEECGPPQINGPQSTHVRYRSPSALDYITRCVLAPATDSYDRSSKAHLAAERERP